MSRLGIKTLKDLLWHLPTRYENYSETIPISDIALDQKVNVQGEVVKITTKKLFPRLRQGFGGQARGMFITNAIVRDMSGAVKVVWFNQPFIENQLAEGTFVSLAGKVKTGKNGTYLSSPTYEKVRPTTDYRLPTTSLKHTKGLIPVYPETEGVTSKYLRFLIKPMLLNIRLNDPTPETILKKYNFPSLIDAVKNIHFPHSEDSAKIAKERLAFDDLMLFQIKALLERRKMNQLRSVPIPFNKELVKNFITGLPFELTKDQKVAAWEILKDLQKKYPMNRLMEGDVGSGKTVVALTAAYQTAKAEYQTVFMVPTEVLANQHFKTITSLVNDSSVKIGLLTASTSKINNENISKKIFKERLSSGEIDIIIGTHAILQKDVSLNRLALLVIDEQHRFGINQRAALVRGNNADLTQKDAEAARTSASGPHGSAYVPHLLSMTATPIPRTLALTIYGDLDISIIREKPKNRQKIITKIIGQNRRRSAYQFIREEVKKGKQVFVVCPRIEATQNNIEQTQNVAEKIPRSSAYVRRQSALALWQDVKAVEEEYKKLSQEVFPDLKVAMLHGKMPVRKGRGLASGGKISKEEIMERFRNGETDILVSTSVIEVGVDIPNATIMAVESAERFGLAQLHQFRGRVGRSEHQSYCLLFLSSGDKSVSQRLKALVACDDGFELAEKDMAIRGPGEFMGIKQSGMPDLAMASLANVELIKKARLEARLLLKEDPSLKKYPLLLGRLNDFQRFTHFE